MIEYKLDDELKSLFSSLKIPQEKIDLEIQRECKFIKYYGFPFFLRKEERDKKIEAITINEYPKAKHLIAYYPYKISADRAKNIELSPEIIEKFLHQGFVWFHESEMVTMW